MPKISFIVPIFNMEKYLHRCLESIKCQTDSDFEVILIDDGSTDSSAAICKEFVEADQRFTYRFQENAWLSAARNTGMQFASGEYISFIDPDDYIESNFIEQLYPYAKETSADILCFGFKWNVNCGDTFVTESPVKRIVDVTEEPLLNHFCVDWLYPQRMNFVWSKLYRRHFLNETGLTFNVNARYCEDRNFCYKLLFQSKRTVYTDYAPYFYYQHEKSIVHSAAIEDNFFSRYLNSYEDISEYWRLKGNHSFEVIKPIVFLRMIQGALFNSLQSKNDLEFMAEKAVQAFASFPIEKVLDIQKLQQAVSIYSEICNLNWGEQSKIWLFALSLLSGKDSMMFWQKLYPGYSLLLAKTN